MIDGASILAVVPARGGSKGLPGKNVRNLRGKPLLAWTIEAAAGSRYIDRLILSSDDEEIIRVGREYGCEVPFIRSAQLALDSTQTIDVVLDALERCPGYDWVVNLQPTSPMRTTDDIDGAIEQCVKSGAESCASVCEVSKSPYWMFTISEGRRLVPLMSDLRSTRRQDLPPVFVLNGAIYVARVDWLFRERRFISDVTKAFVMPAGRSVDIDTESDLVLTEFMLGES